MARIECTAGGSTLAFGPNEVLLNEDVMPEHGFVTAIEVYAGGSGIIEEQLRTYRHSIPCLGDGGI